MNKLSFRLIYHIAGIILLSHTIQSCNSNEDAVEPIEPPIESKNSEIIGSSHVRPTYYFGAEDCLNQGAEELLAMGSKVIKIVCDWSKHDYVSVFRALV